MRSLDYKKRTRYWLVGNNWKYYIHMETPPLLKKGCELRHFLDTYHLSAERGLLRAILAVIRDIGFCGAIIIEQH